MPKAFSRKLGVFVLSMLFMTACSGTKQTSSSKSGQGPSSSDNGGNEYSKVITKDAETDEGLFDVHWVDDKLYYEIPDSLLNREMLLVSRIAEVPTDYFGFFSGGSKTAEQVITFERQRDNILLRKQSYNAVAADTLPIYQSVKANNFAPILASFPIETMNEDSTAMVIEVTDFFTSDIEAISGAISFLGIRTIIDLVNGKPSHAVIFIPGSHWFFGKQNHRLTHEHGQGTGLLIRRWVSGVVCEHMTNFDVLRKTFGTFDVGSITI